MQTQGYERSSVWKRALALLDHIHALTDAFDEDPFGLADRLRSLAIDLPVQAATTFEQLDYDNVKAHADAASAALFQTLLQAQLAGHLELITARELADLRKKLDALDDLFTALPDELFEDDGLSTTQAA